MNSMLYVAIISCGLFSLIQSAPSSSKRLQLRILKHQPCLSHPPPAERIRFASLAKAPLVNDPHRGDGCYSIQGPVSVKKDIRGTVQIYVEAKSGVKSPVEKCTGADSHGCGGFGSCVYCDICAGIKEFERSTSGSVRVETGGGKSFDCEKGVSAGNYTDGKISFCMPTKSEFLEAEGVGEDVWNANGDGGHTFMMTLYIVNKAINNLSPSELQKIADDNSDQLIGCHKLIGSISEGSD
jgi:hypothetical protein